MKRHTISTLFLSEMAEINGKEKTAESLEQRGKDRTRMDGKSEAKNIITAKRTKSELVKRDPTCQKSLWFTFRANESAKNEEYCDLQFRSSLAWLHSTTWVLVRFTLIIASRH